MAQPPGFEIPSDQLQVCRLTKAIYGLKQAPRAWFGKLKSVLFTLGFHNSQADSSLFISSSSAGCIWILIYVDDILVTGSDTKGITKLIDQLSNSFSLKNLGELHNFLGIEVSKSVHGLHLSQTKYITSLLQKAQMLSAKSTPTPMITSPSLSRFKGEPTVDPSFYRSIVGALQYITITRPDISFSVNKVCQFMHSPLDTHWTAVKRILRYLAGSSHLGLFFTKSPQLSLHAYSDSDWAGDIDDRKSVSGFCVYLGNNIVSWCSKKQTSVSRSSAEAEYRSLALASAELIWITSLLHELSVNDGSTPRLWVDNQSAIAIASNPVLHSRTKHVELDVHFVRDLISKNQLSVQFVPSIDQVGDVFTKPLSKQFFSRVRDKLKIHPSPWFELRGDVSLPTPATS